MEPANRQENKKKRSWRFSIMPALTTVIHGVPLRRDTLHFRDKELEQQFQETQFHQTRSHVRFALLFAVVIFLLLGLLDFHLFPNDFWRMWAIRLTSFTPLALLLVLLSYTKEWRVVQPAAAFSMLIAGATNIAIVTEHAGYLGSVYYIGMMLFLIYSYTVLRARFVWLVRAGLGMILFYELVALFITEIPPDVYLINNVFLIAANASGMVAAYTIEYFTRRDFVQNILFMKSADSLALSISDHERHLRDFIESAKDVVLFRLRQRPKGEELIVDQVSPAIQEALGLDQDQQLRFESWFSGSTQVDHVLQTVQQVMRDKTRLDTELRIHVPKSHQVRWFRLLVLSVHDRRSSDAIALGILIDVTDQKMLTEKQADLLEQKNRFINVLAHQINTPLNVVKWGVETLLSRTPGNLAQKQAMLLGGIQEASERMISVLQDVLSAMALADGKKVPLRTEELSVADIVIPVITKLDHLLSKRSFMFTPNAMESYELYGDRDKLQLAFHKILENTIDYSREGDQIEVVIEKEGSMAKITIADAGVGIPSAERPHVFDLFYRGKQAMRLQPNRTGAGLALARLYLRAHGGDLYLIDSHNDLTTFVVKLPLR